MGCDREALIASVERHVQDLADIEDYDFGSDKERRLKTAAKAAAAEVDDALRTTLESGTCPSEFRAQCFFLKGRAVSFLQGQDATAESLLGKALKLDPQLLGAWLALGELHWNHQDFQKAYDSFGRALEISDRSTAALRGLSMVLRALDGAGGGDDAGGGQRAANYALALQKAKAAVALDAADPLNWETLGNAYAGDYFVNAARPDEINKALVAYQKAESLYDALGKSSPTLQLNRGMAAKYIEDYALALRSFAKAKAIGSASAAGEWQKVADLVRRFGRYTERKGELKGRRLLDLISEVPRGDSCRALRDLRGEGEKAASGADAPLAAKAVAIVGGGGDMPVVLACCDTNGDFFALSLYNAEASAVADMVVPLKSLLYISQPKFRQVVISCPPLEHTTYPSVRVAHPADVTIAGRGPLACAGVRSVFSSGAVRAETATEPSLSVEEREEVQATKNPALDKWIDEEDAKTKAREAKAKARAARAKAKKAKARGSKARPLRAAAAAAASRRNAAEDDAEEEGEEEQEEGEEEAEEHEEQQEAEEQPEEAEEQLGEAEEQQEEDKPQEEQQAKQPLQAELPSEEGEEAEAVKVEETRAVWPLPLGGIRGVRWTDLSDSDDDT